MTILRCIQSCLLFLVLHLPLPVLAAFPVGVPSDVLRDYQSWLGPRDVFTLERFDGTNVAALIWDAIEARRA